MVNGLALLGVSALRKCKQEMVLTAITRILPAGAEALDTVAHTASGGNVWKGMLIGLFVGWLRQSAWPCSSIATTIRLPNQGCRQAAEPAKADKKHAAAPAPEALKPGAGTSSRRHRQCRATISTRYRRAPRSWMAAPAQPVPPAKPVEEKPASAPPAWFQVGAFQNESDADNLKAAGADRRRSQHPDHQSARQGRLAPGAGRPAESAGRHRQDASDTAPERYRSQSDPALRAAAGKPVVAGQTGGCGTRCHCGSVTNSRADPLPAWPAPWIFGSRDETVEANLPGRSGGGFMAAGSASIASAEPLKLRIRRNRSMSKARSK